LLFSNFYSSIFAVIPIKAHPDNGHVSFVEFVKMITQISPTIELNPELTNLAYELGLNPSKICENALNLAIRRLQGLSVEKTMVDEPGFEHETSTMPLRRSISNYFPENTELITI